MRGILRRDGEREWDSAWARMDQERINLERTGFKLMPKNSLDVDKSALHFYCEKHDFHQLYTATHFAKSLMYPKYIKDDLLARFIHLDSQPDTQRG